jgi:hypothetical protein
MRHAFIGLCIFTAACSSQTLSPTSPSSATGRGAQAQAGGASPAEVIFTKPSAASGGAPVEVTFTKWITAYPAMAGVTGGDVAGTFAGAILDRVPFDNGTIVQLQARYGVTATNPTHSFVAIIDGKLNNTTQKAVLNGTVTSGWLAGARVHVTFDVIVPPTGTSCVPAAPVNSTCFQGTIRIMPDPAN